MKTTFTRKMLFNQIEDTIAKVDKFNAVNDMGRADFFQKEVDRLLTILKEKFK